MRASRCDAIPMYGLVVIRRIERVVACQPERRIAIARQPGSDKAVVDRVINAQIISTGRR